MMLKLFALECLFVAVVICKADIDAEVFLTSFGYLNKNAFNGVSVTDAIKEYQEFNNLEVTGVVDTSTKAEMAKPRCGNADRNGYNSKQKWPKSSLTYSFRNRCEDLNDIAVRQTIREAFKMWSDVTNLGFTEISGGSDITIGFHHRSHGDNSPFDGPNGVLAHAYMPTNGRLCFDEGEKWVIKTTGTDLFEIAVHEIGHILGLEHSNIRGTIMFPSYSGYRPNLQLHQDDRIRIQQLYGVKTGTGTGTGGSCTDKVNDCYTNIANCRINQDWINYMKAYCAKSCRYCN